MRHTLVMLSALALLIAGTSWLNAQPKGERATIKGEVVDLCDALKLAAERGLPQRAIYRGANPQADLSVATLKGLREDGLLAPTDKPAPITATDIGAATYIFSIGCALPSTATSTGKAEDWSDVPQVSDGYAAARDAIRRHVEKLVDRLPQRWRH